MKQFRSHHRGMHAAAGRCRRCSRRTSEPLLALGNFRKGGLVRMLAVLVCLCLPSAVSASDNALKSTLKDQKSVSVTVYNSNLGLVKDIRSLALPKGVVHLTFEGVASQIDPTSVHIRSLDHPLDLSVLEQNFEYDLISPEKLMEKYLGREIELVTKDDSGEHTKSAKLLGIEKGFVYEIDGKIAVNPPGRVVMPTLPEGLISQPSLIWMLDSGRQDHTVEASYLTSGMSWRANYVAVLSGDDRALDLSGWVTIDNRSGAAYNDASLKLIAGDVNRVEQPAPYAKANVMMADEMQARGGFEEKAFFEYHMYDLQRKTTLKNNQTKQIRLMDAAGVMVVKQFVYSSQNPYFYYPMGDADTDTKVGVFLSLENAKKNNLGMPLPKGVVRVFKKDDDGALEFLGEDQIDHTPEDETIRIKLGNAFDIVAERVQTDFKQYRNTYESAYKITVRNHKDERIVVSVVEHLAGDWKILENSHEYVKESAFKVRFDVPVEKKGEAELIYRVSIKR